MLKTMFRNVLLIAAFLFSMHTLEAAAAGKQKANSRPRGAVIQKDGKKFQRRCFTDKDKNGFCDRGTEQKGKCKNNCRALTAEEKKLPNAAEEPKKQIQKKFPKQTAPQISLYRLSAGRQLCRRMSGIYPENSKLFLTLCFAHIKITPTIRSA